MSFKKAKIIVSVKDTIITHTFQPINLTMKKLFTILTLTAFMTSCNDTDTKAAAESDSAKAVATADSLAAIKALADTVTKITDTTTIKVDSIVKVDSTKK